MRKTHWIAATAVAGMAAMFSGTASAHDPLAGALIGGGIGAAVGGGPGAAVGAVLGTIAASDHHYNHDRYSERRYYYDDRPVRQYAPTSYYYSAPAPVYYSAPPVYYSSPVYYSTPVYYSPYYYRPAPVYVSIGYGYGYRGGYRHHHRRW